MSDRTHLSWPFFEPRHRELAHAIVRDARTRGVRLRDVAAFQNLAGEGVRGKLDGDAVLLGRRELLETGTLEQAAGLGADVDIAVAGAADRINEHV